VDYILGLGGGLLLAAIVWLLDKSDSSSLDKQAVTKATDDHKEKKKEVRAALAAENAEERMAAMINEKLK
tara:strand:- start:1538 stop:1747 length:210 start_codon:yes stop_codon:yes gene_type:complete